MKTYSLNTLVVLLVLGAVSSFFFPHAYAQTTDEIGILPDSPLYNFKLWGEAFEEFFVFDEVRKAEVILEHAEIRKAEADTLERRMIAIPPEVLQNHREKVAEAERIIKEFEERNERTIAQQENVRQIQIDQSEQRIQPVGLEKITDFDNEATIVSKLRERLDLAFSDTQVIEIKQDFQKLRESDDTREREVLSEKIDREVNNPIVNISCLGRINSLDIADSPDPVKRLQDQCLFLKPIPTDDLRKMLASER